MATNDELTRDHAAAVAQAAKYFDLLARSTDLPMTPMAFEERLERMMIQCEKRADASDALLIAILRDEWVPCAFFKPWSSYATIHIWSKRDDEHRLPTKLLNGKLCVKPNEFFRVFKFLGCSDEPKNAVAKRRVLAIS